MTEDLHLNEKHKQIYPSEHELAVVQRSVRTVELALKEVADVLVDDDVEASGEKNTEAEKAEGYVSELKIFGNTNTDLLFSCPSF